ncbi:MAG: bacteriohemerythrin [Oscillospiraceae bacterium]|jgi:hemerythrin-like metal-binding protein|nr:bacteriohemerythrin [Oscillospiraceae bacterium]
MWKDSYRIGVASIDEQHKALFDATEKLLSNLRENHNSRREECIAAIAFLKDYAVRHFADEEDYQLSVGYRDYKAHKKLHQGFVKTVLFHKKKMTESDFDLKDIKEFTGMLITWLTYHVAGIDQEITGEKAAAADKGASARLDCFLYAVRDVLHKLAGLDTDAVNTVAGNGGDMGDRVCVDVEFTGDASGRVGFVYSGEFTRNVIFAMIGFYPDESDELVQSALLEISNIISGTVCLQFIRAGILCDIMPPVLSDSRDTDAKDKILLDTGVGLIEINVNLT